MDVPPIVASPVSLVEAFKAASDTMHVLITINSALIGGTITFQKDFFASTGRATSFVVTAFILFGLSILAAVLCLMAITGCMADPPDDGINHLSIRMPAFLALMFFTFGIAAYVTAGIYALHQPRKGA